jgi:hypothetical protein
MKFRVGDIQPNPFRHMDRYPIRREKVAALRESLRTTGYWDNVVGRLTSDGPQIAYGHHRLAALRDEFTPDYEVELIIRELSDDQMLKIMARENMEEWGTSAAIEQETVRAVVEAYAEGRIHLQNITSKTTMGMRSAPSFLVSGPGAHQDHPNTAQTIADFLGWTEPNGQPQQKLRYALTALSFIEEGILTESDFDGLSTTQAKAVVDQARRVRKERDDRARIRAEQAAQAARQAQEAEARRVQAEENKRTEEAEKAELDRLTAERRRELALEAERQERERGRQQAADVGRHVSKQLKDGHRGTREAAEIAAEKRDDIPRAPQDINDAAHTLALKIEKIFDPRLDNQAAQLEKMLPFQDFLTENSVMELVNALECVVERFRSYQGKLASPAVMRVHAEAEIIDAEVVGE